MSEYRKAYFKQLVPRFQDIMTQLAPSLDGLELRYQQGWDKQVSYQEALSTVSALIWSRAIPMLDHSARISGYMLEAVWRPTLCPGASRKLVVCGLKLAQGQLMSELGKRECTYLIDDLPSELDLEHSELVCELLGFNGGAGIYYLC